MATAKPATSQVVKCDYPDEFEEFCLTTWDENTPLDCVDANDWQSELDWDEVALNSEFIARLRNSLEKCRADQ